MVFNFPSIFSPTSPLKNVTNSSQATSVIPPFGLGFPSCPICAGFPDGTAGLATTVVGMSRGGSVKHTASNRYRACPFREKTAPNAGSFFQRMPRYGVGDGLGRLVGPQGKGLITRCKVQHRRVLPPAILVPYGLEQNRVVVQLTSGRWPGWNQTRCTPRCTSRNGCRWALNDATSCLIYVQSRCHTYPTHADHRKCGRTEFRAIFDREGGAT